MLSLLTDRAKDFGFTGVGFSRPGRPLYFDRFRAWVSHRKNADMSWLARNMEVREDPSRMLKGCQTIISLAYPYPPRKPATPDGFTVSRYSQPTKEDYHYRLKTLGKKLAVMIEEMFPGSRSRVCVDSVPLLEKSFSCASGVGFMGKNNMLIVPGHGSYFYLAEILTTAPLEFSSIVPPDNQCGSCKLCIDSCPTGALEKPFYLDAARCLSYLTIEYKGTVSGENGKRMGDCFFGCDRCQEVCPFNEGKMPKQVSLPSTEEFLGMTEEGFKKRFGKTVFSRAGLEKLKTNIHAVRP